MYANTFRVTVGLKFSHRIRPDLSFDDLIRLYEVKALRCSSSRPDPVMPLTP